MLSLPYDILGCVLLPMVHWKQACTVLTVVCKDLSDILRPALSNIYEHRTRTTEQLHMLSEDDRRFQPHTFSYLEAWCTAWATHILDNPWWGRPPCRERGALVDAKDFQKSWCPAQIVDWRDETRICPPLAPHAVVHGRNTAAFGSSARIDVCTMYKIRFLGWHARWDEWLPATDIKGFGSRTFHPVREKVASCKQWMLQKQNGEWDVYLVRAHAVTSVQHTFLPATDVLCGLLVEGRGLYGTRI